MFDPLPSISVDEIDEQMNEAQVKQVDDEYATEMKILPHDKLVQLQSQDEQCAKLIKLLKDNKMSPRKPYFLEKDVLYKIVKEDAVDYEVVLLPKALIGHVLMGAHNNLGHNGIQHTYALIR